MIYPRISLQSRQKRTDKKSVRDAVRAFQKEGTTGGRERGRKEEKHQNSKRDCFHKYGSCLTLPIDVSDFTRTATCHSLQNRDVDIEKKYRIYEHIRQFRKYSSI